MKCDNCNKPAEYGLDGEETILCTDCFVEQGEVEELIKKLREIHTYRWLNEYDRKAILKAADIIEETKNESRDKV